MFLYIFLHFAFLGGCGGGGGGFGGGGGGRIVKTRNVEKYKVMSKSVCM